MKHSKDSETSPEHALELPAGMCCHFYRSPYRFQDAFVKAIQDDFNAMNESSYGGQITMKYRREKESFYIVGDRDSGKCEQAFVLSHPISQIRFVKFLVNIKRIIERTKDDPKFISRRRDAELSQILPSPDVEGEKLRLQKQREIGEEKSAPIESVEDPTPQKIEDASYVWKPTGRMLLFTHGIDLAKDIARNCGVTAYVDWVANTVTLTSQDPDLITRAVERFNKLEEFYNRPGLPFLYLQTMLRLNKNLEKKLVIDIEILRTTFPGTVPPSVVGKEAFKRRGSVCESTSDGPITLGDGIGIVFNRVPLTKESLDLMDTPIPSGVLAEEFAYHGFAPSHVKELHQAHQLLDEIYTEIKKHSVARREKVYQEFELALEYTRAHQGDCKLAIRLGKVKTEHRQMESGKWEDPLRGKMRATFKDDMRITKETLFNILNLQTISTDGNIIHLFSQRGDADYVIEVVGRWTSNKDAADHHWKPCRMFIDGNSSNYLKIIDKWQPVVCADILGEPESAWDCRLELSTALHARQTIKPFKQFLKGVAISQFDKEAVDIKFDTVEGFLLIDQILHRKTFNYEVRHSKFTSDSSRIGMRVSEVRDLGIFKPLTLNEKKYQARSTNRQEMEEQGRFYLNVELFNIDAEKLFVENTGLTTGEEAKWTPHSSGVLGLNYEALDDLCFVAGLVSREIPFLPFGPTPPPAPTSRPAKSDVL